MSCLSLLNATESLIEEYIKNRGDSKELATLDTEDVEFMNLITKRAPMDIKRRKFEDFDILDTPKFKKLDSVARSWIMLAGLESIKHLDMADLVMMSVMALRPYGQGGSIYPAIVWNIISAKIGQYLDIGYPQTNPLAVFGPDVGDSFICALGKPKLSGIDIGMYIMGKLAVARGLNETERSYYFFDEELEESFARFNKDTNETANEFIHRVVKEQNGREPLAEREYLYGSLYPLLFAFIVFGHKEEFKLASEIYKLNKGYGVTEEMIEDFSVLAWQQFLLCQYSVACLTNSPDTKEICEEVINYHRCYNQEGSLHRVTPVYMNLQAIRNFINKD